MTEVNIDMATWTKETKTSTSWEEIIKNSQDWTEEIKNRVISTFLLTEEGGYLLQEDTGKIALTLDWLIQEKH